MIGLNLIPKEKKSIIKQEILFNRVKRVAIHVGIFMLIVLASLITARYILAYYHQEVTINIEKVSTTSRTENLDAQIKELNDQLVFIKKIQEEHQSLPELMTYFLNTVPDNITLQSTMLDAKIEEVLIKGIAKERNDLINFENALKDSAVFSEISLPFSSLLLKEDIEFEISGTFDLSLIETIENEQN